MNQLHTPLLDRLILHDEKRPTSFHVPGHKYGQLFPQKGRDYFQSILRLDATEVTGLDDLHSPEEVILDAENLLSEFYDTRKSFFLVNGSTSGNLAMILATVNKDDLVLVQRNSHKSILNGIKLANAHPVFLNPEYNREAKVASGVSIETVRQAIETYPKAKALILTYPNYYGMVYNLKEIIKLAHRHNIPVLVDGAHGVHFISGDPFPASAVSLGADIVVQSAHKTLPAMTMGAFIHYNSGNIPLEKLRYFLQVVQSSSPSYPIMASLDAARSYLATFNDKDKKTCISAINRFREDIRAISNLSVLSVPNSDPLKMIIQHVGGLNGFELQKRFEEHGLFAELADPFNVLFVLPLLKDEKDFPFQQALDRINSAMMGMKAEWVSTSREFFQLPSSQPKVTVPVISYEEMASLQTEYVPISKAIGKICAETIIPYPPGVPLFYPGEKMQNEGVETLMYFLNEGAKIQGGELLSQKEIKIFK